MYMCLHVWQYACMYVHCMWRPDDNLGYILEVLTMFLLELVSLTSLGIAH